MHMTLVVELVDEEYMDLQTNSGIYDGRNTYSHYKIVLEMDR